MQDTYPLKVPDARDVAIQLAMQTFWLPSAYKSYVHTTLQSTKCDSNTSKTTNIHTLIKNSLLLKYANHHLRLQQVLILLLAGVLPQCCCLLTDQGGGCLR